MEELPLRGAVVASKQIRMTANKLIRMTTSKLIWMTASKGISMLFPIAVSLCAMLNGCLWQCWVLSVECWMVAFGNVEFWILSFELSAKPMLNYARCAMLSFECWMLNYSWLKPAMTNYSVLNCELGILNSKLNNSTSAKPTIQNSKLKTQNSNQSLRKMSRV